MEEDTAEGLLRGRGGMFFSKNSPGERGISSGYHGRVILFIARERERDSW